MDADGPGLAALFAGVVLDVILMPINKSLWTTSYCFLTTGWALVMFSVFYWLLDAAPGVALRARLLGHAKFFTIYGMNALFIFALSGLVAKMIGFFKLGPLLYAPVKALPLQPQAASLVYALAFNAVMFAVAWFMWRRRWFVKV